MLLSVSVTVFVAEISNLLVGNLRENSAPFFLRFAFWPFTQRNVLPPE
jgi:hypothetical protein